MGNIHDVFKEDDLNGIIVGGSMITGYLFYGDKKAVYRQLWARSEDELIKKAEEVKVELLEDNKEIKWDLWPDSSKWNLRINL